MPGRGPRCTGPGNRLPVSRDIIIPVTGDSTPGAVNDLMMSRGVCLAIITDESKRPVSYVSTDDIRKEFLTM